MGNYIPWSLIKKYFQDNLSDIENRQLELWKNTNKLNQAIYKEILEDESIKNAVITNKWENSSLGWQKILTKIKLPARKISFSRKLFYAVGGIAASIILFFSILSITQFIRLKEIQSPENYTSIYSPRGQRTSIILPDQSKVWLNSESLLKYPSNYNQKTRNVIIDGEAFFEVTNNIKKPFIVETNELKVKVYGTSFNVKAFSKEKYIETTLIKGKLSIIPVNSEGEESNEIFLKPEEKCIYEKSTSEIISNPDKKPNSDANEKKLEETIQSKADNKPKIMVKRNIDLEPEELWKDGKLIFKNETFSELAIKMERWFDVKIHFEDKIIKNYKFTGVFEKETINQAMEALRVSSQNSYKYDIVFRDIYLKIE